MLRPEEEKMLEVDAAWLNAWHQSEENKITDFPVVTRANYDEWDDPPKVVFVHSTGERRVVYMRCTPFHDEGGAAELVAMFRRYYPGDPWTMDWMVREFDTMGTLVYSDGKLDNVPEPEKEDA